MRALMRLTLGLIAVLSAAPATAGKLGFLDAERAVVTVQEGKSQLKVLEEWGKTERASIEQLQGEVASLTRRIAAQRGTAPAETLAQLERDLLQTQRQLEDRTRIFNREATARREKILSELAAKIGTVAGEYAEANEFDVVFLLGAQPLAYHSRALDITETVIRLYDERFPVRPGAAE